MKFFRDYPLTLLDRALGAYLGLAVGDALGATVEFMTAREIAAQYGVHRQMIGGGWLKLKAGQVTDDTTMALALGDAIVKCKDWNLHEVAEHFATWLRGMPVDCGNTCRRGIRRYMLEGTLSGLPNEGDAGNGAVMRNLPVVLGFLNNDALLEQFSHEQGRITHHHPLSDQANLAFARISAALIRGQTLEQVRPIADALIEQEPKFGMSRYRGRASAYVVDTVQTVLYHFFQHDDFESCVTAVVNQGEDADTTGALAGMLAGALYGVQSIPKHWLRKLDPDIRHRIEVQTRQLLSLHSRLA